MVDRPEVGPVLVVRDPVLQLPFENVVVDAVPGREGRTVDLPEIVEVRPPPLDLLRPPFGAGLGVLVGAVQVLTELPFAFEEGA